MHVHSPATTFPEVSFGSWRLWDGAGQWAKVQPSINTWDFVKCDEYVAKAVAHKSKILFTLGLTPTWASSRPTEASNYNIPGSAAMPRNINEWRTYVKTVATRYKGKVEAYEVWNEANTPAFWTGTIAQLVELTKAACQEIKLIDPLAKVISPSGIGTWDDRTRWVKDFLDAGGSKWIDVISYHLYTGVGPPEDFAQGLLDMRATLQPLYSKFPMWNTEAGYYCAGSSFLNWSDAEKVYNQNSNDVSDYIIRAMLLARSLDFQRFYWYAWDNTKLGFIDPSSKLSRESASTLEKFNKIFSGNGVVASCTRDSNGVWVAKIKTAAGGNGQVVWVDPAAAALVQMYALPFTSNISDFHDDSVVKFSKSTEIKISTNPKLMIWV